MKKFSMKLKQIAHIAVGYPFRGKVPEVVGSNVLAVQMKDISVSEGINWSTCVETETQGKRDPDWLRAGSILFVARGSNNYSVLIDDSVEDKKAVAAPHLYIITPKKPTFLPEYLAWYLNQEPCLRYFQRESEGTLTKSIRRAALEETPIAVPSLDRQKSIVALAETLRKEQQLLNQLISNGQLTMNAIAAQLVSKEFAAEQPVKTI
jgi:restriction endonuclease S subunit